MKYCENCGRMHDGPLWETFLDGDNKPLELLLCSTPRYKEDDETKEDDDNEETPSKPETDKHKGYKEEDKTYENETKEREYNWQEEIKYELPSLFGL